MPAMSAVAVGQAQLGLEPPQRAHRGLPAGPARGPVLGMDGLHPPRRIRGSPGALDPAWAEVLPPAFRPRAEDDVGELLGRRGSAAARPGPCAGGPAAADRRLRASTGRAGALPAPGGGGGSEAGAAATGADAC